MENKKEKNIHRLNSCGKTAGTALVILPTLCILDNFACFFLHKNYADFKKKYFYYINSLKNVVRVL